MAKKLVNALNKDVTQRGEANEKLQNETKPVVQRDLAMLSTIPQATPHTSTQPRVVNVHHDDNHELVQLFNKVVSTKQPWQSVTPCYYLPKMNALT